MTNLKIIYILALLIFSLITCGQTKIERTIHKKSFAEKELKFALSNKFQHNIINNKSTIIKDSLTAIKIAEPILFSIYGIDNIIKQRPYEIYLIDNYWIIEGTLSENYLGGTFLIIISSKDCKVIKITHGK